jgi:hypothetical protein
MRSARSIVLGNNTLTIRTFLFSLRIVSTSTCMHREFLRLLFLQAHLETEAHFTATGMPSHHRHVPFSPRGLPSLPKLERRAAFYQGLVGLAAAKTAALRINLTIDSCGVVAAPSHAPSRTPILLPILLSHQIAFPPPSPVRDGQTRPHQLRFIVSTAYHHMSSTIPLPTREQLCNRTKVGHPREGTRQSVCCEPQ